jgi:hypothetical protein
MKTWLLVLATVLLTGCATKAYRAVENECAPQAWADYPENKMQVIQTRQRIMHVATGMRNCYTRKDGNHVNTICNDITRPEFINYQEVVVVDQNEAVRNMAIASCSSNLCMQRYGNAQCKTDQLLVPLPTLPLTNAPELVPSPVSQLNPVSVQ